MRSAKHETSKNGCKFFLDLLIPRIFNLTHFLLLNQPTPHVVTREKNSPTAAPAGRKRRLKLVPGAWGIAGPPYPEGINTVDWPSRLGVGRQDDKLSP
jgi:hypothetical protein